jgi:hypothetical protein
LIVTSTLISSLTTLRVTREAAKEAERLLKEASKEAEAARKEAAKELEAARKQVGAGQDDTAMHRALFCVHGAKCAVVAVLPGCGGKALIRSTISC